MTGGSHPHPPVKWGILSTARIAGKLWRALRECGVAEVAAVASRDLSRAHAFVDKCQMHAPFAVRPEAYGSYEELLAREDIECVYVPLPTAVRKEWVLRAIQARKNVLVEKPVGESASDVREMVKAAIQAGVHLMDGVMFMHSSRLPALRTSLSEIGPIRTIHTSFSFRGDHAFFEHDIRASGTTEPLGCLGDLGWYCIRFTLWAREWAMPLRARATMHAQSDAGVPFELTAEMLWPDGSSATFFCSFLAQCTQFAAIAATNGTIEIPDFVLPVAGRNSRYTVCRQAILSDGLDVVVDRHDTKIAVQEASHGHRTSQEACMVRHFSDLSRKGPVCTHHPEEILETQRLLDAILMSAKGKGDWVDLVDE